MFHEHHDCAGNYSKCRSFAMKTNNLPTANPFCSYGFSVLGHFQPTYNFLFHLATLPCWLMGSRILDGFGPVLLCFSSLSQVKAKEWTEVSAAGAPFKRYDHAAVMDAQQRMWVFGGRSGWYGDSVLVFRSLAVVFSRFLDIWSILGLDIDSWHQRLHAPTLRSILQ